MRWKLLLIASLSATAVGAGAILTLAVPVYSNPDQSPRRLAIAGAILIPLVATTVASIFVYRHTPRRRKLQAASTALLTCFLTLSVVISAALIWGRKRIPEAAPSSTPTSERPPT